MFFSRVRQCSVLTGSIKLRAIGLDENKEKKMIVYNCINLQNLHEGEGAPETSTRRLRCVLFCIPILLLKTFESFFVFHSGNNQ